MLRKSFHLLLLLCVCFLLAQLFVPPSLGNAQTAIVFPGAAWQTRTPNQVGLDPAKLNQFVSNLSSGTTSSGVIIRDGYLVMSWGNVAQKFDWASAAKPLHSSLLLFALYEGRIASVESPVRQWGWAMRTADQNLSFHQLANMTSGYARAESPGAAWAYNDYAAALYARTLERVFAASLNSVTLRRLASLQFQDGSVFSSRNGYGVSTSVRDFARIGWWWLNRGNWQGRQLLPTGYFDTYMRPQVPGTLRRTSGSDTDYLNVGTFGGGSDQTAYGPGIYGYNWWFNARVGTTTTLTWPDAPPDTFFALGHWNVEGMVMIPSLRMVVAAKGNWGSFAPGNRNAGMNRNLRLLVEAAGTTRVSPPTLTPTLTRPQTQSGLTGEYYNGMNFETFILRRTDSTINFNWGASSPTTGVNPDSFSVRWSGYVIPRYSETYTFYTKTGDGVRLWVNGRQLINAWWAQDVTERSATIALTAGQPVAITMEYFEKWYSAEAYLSWSSSRQPKEIIPAGQLSTSATSAGQQSGSMEGQAGGEMVRPTLEPTATSALSTVPLGVEVPLLATATPVPVQPVNSEEGASGGE
jgi:hypothetical protein